MTSEQHVATFRAFLTRPPESTRAWAHARSFRNTSDAGVQTALLRDVTEKVDFFVDPDRLWVVAYLPWAEMLLLIASVTASYTVLL